MLFLILSSLCLFISWPILTSVFGSNYNKPIKDVCDVPKLTSAKFADRCNNRAPYICSLSPNLFSYDSAEMIHKEIYRNASHLQACPCLTANNSFCKQMQEQLALEATAQKSASTSHKARFPQRAPAKIFNIAFVMIDTLRVMQGKVPSLADNFCDINIKSSAYRQQQNISLQVPARSVQIYADYLRRRWSTEACTTHILVLMVDRFATPGDLYFADTDFVAVAFESKDFMTYVSNDSALHAAVRELSDRKSSASSSGIQERLKKLQIFIKRMDYVIRSGERLRSNAIPQWALGLLIFCSVFGLALAAIGGRVNTSRTGASAFKMGKSSNNRQWKAGFSGGVWGAS